MRYDLTLKQLCQDNPNQLLHSRLYPSRILHSEAGLNAPDNS